MRVILSILKTTKRKKMKQYKMPRKPLLSKRAKDNIIATIQIVTVSVVWGGMILGLIVNV